MRLHASVSRTVWTIGAVFWAVGMTYATPLTVYNQCDESIDLYDNTATETIAAGGSTTRTLAEGFSGMFRSGVDAQATLAEFAITGGYTWYDISIIPTGPLGGPGSCSSLEDCKTATGGVGFNLPMQIAPSGCTAVTCLADGCEDAYQFPSDDGKTHACPEASSVDLIFCPGGSGSTTTTTTTTTPETEAPATEMPTVEATSAPTTQATVAATAAPSAASSSSGSQVTSTSQDPSSTALRGSAASEADSATLTPEINLTPATSAPSATPIASLNSSSAGSAEVVSTQSEDSGSPVSTYVVSTLGALVIAAAVVVVLVVRHKKKQLEAMEPKESDYSSGGLLTP